MKLIFELDHQGNLFTTYINVTTRSTISIGNDLVREKFDEIPAPTITVTIEEI